MKLSFMNVCRVGLLVSVIALAACSGNSSRGVGGVSGLVISGNLDLGASSMSVNQKTGAVQSYNVNAAAVEFDDLEVVATAATEPPTTVTGTVAADGTFSIDLGAAAVGSAITITFVDEVTDAVVGEVKFTDDSKKDLNGNPKADSTVVATGSLPLGNILLAEDGTVEIPKANIAAIQQDAPVASSTAFDPTGEWTMDTYEKVPVSYTVGAYDPNDPGMPHVGFKVTLARFTGKDFTPANGNCQKNASGTITSCPITSGTVGTGDRYALSIWGGNYTNSIGACGGKTGFSADEARGYGGIHLTSLPTVSAAAGAMTFGPYGFTTGTGFGGDPAPFNQAWMKTGALAQHEEADCRSYLVSGTTKMYNAWACRSKVYTGNWPGTPVSTGTQIGWQIGLQGSGCKNMATNDPVNVTNWQNMGLPTCATPTSATAVGTGFTNDSCTYSNADHDGVSSTAAININCTHTGGRFTDSGGSPSSTPLSLPDGQYLGKPETIIAYNAPCHSASGTAAATLAAYRCYANAYWQSGDSQTQDGSCRRDYQFNWQATNTTDFVSRDDFKGRPRNAFVTNILNYALDGKSAMLEDEETESVTIPTSANSSTFCRVVRKTQLTFKSITATKMLVELRESGRMASTDAACVAAANVAMTDKQNELHWMLEPVKMFFYLNKAN